VKPLGVVSVVAVALAVSTAVPLVAAASRADIVARASRSVVLVDAGGAQGSAFAFGAPGEYLTNAHVVEGVSRVVLVTKDGRRESADVVGRNSRADVAQLRSSLVLPALHAATAPPRAGDDVLAIGAPHGLEGTVTRGIVSAVGRNVHGVSMIQTDVAVNPGSSGGPLLTSNGAVLGLTTAKAQGEEGIAFAIPIATATGALDGVPSPPAPPAEVRSPPPAVARPGGSLGTTWIAAIAASVALAFGLAGVLARRIVLARRAPEPATLAVEIRSRPEPEPVVVVRRRAAAAGSELRAGSEHQRQSEEQWT